MELKHTPAPWTVMGMDKNFVLFEESTQIHEYNTWRVTQVIGRPWSDDEKMKEEAQANTRLIAAAPEMLAALIELYSALENKRLYPDIKNIIEKATGAKVEDIIGKE